MKALKPVVLLLALSLLTGCWDRLEVEDGLFPVTMAVDKGAHRRYKVALRVPISGRMRAGVLGGNNPEGGTSEMISAEGDTVWQALYVMNAAVTRRITMRHMRGVIVGEPLAREGLTELFNELGRNGELRQTSGFWVARGSADEILANARPTGEFNPGKINEGLLLVEKHLHMAPHIRLHHMLNRSAAVGVDPFAPVVALNRKIMGQDGDSRVPTSSVAGDLNRAGLNPVETAGTAVFQNSRLKGFLTVDETQLLLALRGEMGKAYMTFPDPMAGGRSMILRLQQENLPQYRASIAAGGPRVALRLLFEAEVISGAADFADPQTRQRIEDAVGGAVVAHAQSVLRKTREWQTDPVGLGLQFRSHFATWHEWARYRWRDQIPKLKVQVSATVRIRRFGLLIGPTESRGE